MNSKRYSSGEETHPLLLGNLVYTRDRKLIGFFVKTRDVPGIVAGITKVFADLRLNIVSIYFNPVIAGGDVGTGFIVADFTGQSYNPEIVAERIRKLEGVIEVRVVLPQHRNVLLDPYHFPIVGLEGERYILAGEVMIEGVVKGLSGLLGSSAASSFRYHLGMVVGKSLYGMIRNLGAKTPREALELLILYSHQWGRYKGRIARYRYRGMPDDVIVLHLQDNWECEKAEKLGIPGPAAHVERGIVAGVLESATGRRVRVEETRCIASGHPYCEFRISFQS